VRNHKDSRLHEIWEVCRATTAAPTYFKPIKIDGNYYSDGGTGANNPTFEAIREMRLLHGHSLRLVASFGTGKAENTSIFMHTTKGHPHLLRVVDHGNRIFKRARAALTESEKTHELVEECFKHANGTEYCRFNVEERLGKVKLNEWAVRRDAGDGTKCSTLDYIEKCTGEELAKESVQKSLTALARQLVELRRQRTRDLDRWERFATCTTYKCRDERCRLDTGELFTCSLRRDMKEHIRFKHEEKMARLGETLQRCRTEPEFPAGPY
jgi:hypothetical protein